MKNSFLLKSLVDILYIILFMGLGGMILLIPFVMFHLDGEIITLKDFSSGNWISFSLKILTYLILLRGLYFLRKVLRSFLSEQIFNWDVVKHLMKSGWHLFYSGILYIGFVSNSWLWKINKDNLEMISTSFTIIPLLLMIIGLFFVIQSRFVKKAILYKEEIDLTV